MRLVWIPPTILIIQAGEDPPNTVVGILTNPEDLVDPGSILGDSVTRRTEEGTIPKMIIWIVLVEGIPMIVEE